MSNALSIYNAHYGESHEAGLAAVFKAGADSVVSSADAAVAHATPTSELEDAIAARDKRIVSLQDELDQAGSKLSNVYKEMESERASLQNEVIALGAKVTELSEAAAKPQVLTISASDVGDLTKVISDAKDEAKKPGSK